MTPALRYQLYTNAYRHWITQVEGESYTKVDPLWNNHRRFWSWLCDNFRVEAKLKDLTVQLKFEDAAAETLFILRWS
jgi:hypothetical protein